MIISMRPKPFSDQIRDAVNASGMSRYRICAEIKLSQPAMSRFMAGNAGLSLAVLDKLADLLGLEVATKPKRTGRG
jgi:transcriptional regulator with XRE-family HTH domain